MESKNAFHGIAAKSDKPLSFIKMPMTIQGFAQAATNVFLSEAYLKLFSAQTLAL
jgi:hypothetical protein